MARRAIPRAVAAGARPAAGPGPRARGTGGGGGGGGSGGGGGGGGGPAGVPGPRSRDTAAAVVAADRRGEAQGTLRVRQDPRATSAARAGTGAAVVADRWPAGRQVTPAAAVAAERRERRAAE